ncbi:phospholipid/glycerol acyltransferase [Isosphaera pallida ATCC 43644]|uniref:Phospholipid/glycerol acyltransferase n=1 Tax=Isosphaera pallida (strain ATCC 43644 / DSM 9630 / IS1B) TaxID=575540 RepID=E8QWR3_ISOPI|nr:lysophospholipid acyltransferase family protein [Isosphaera pallida]ADV62963.1 phospholipid/glycerol acyltransferase [Isosphaera pallida ATCC 43644]
MDRLALRDDLSFDRFHPPRLSRFWVWATRPLRRAIARWQHRVDRLELTGADHLTAILKRGGSVLIAANHADRADGFTLIAIGEAVGRPFHMLAAHQLLVGEFGARRWLFSRLGVVPVDREGDALPSLRASIDLLKRGEPLVVFPEGEIYSMSDRLTPPREGLAGLALMARRSGGVQDLSILPLAMKHQYRTDENPLPELLHRMERLERFFTWTHDGTGSLLERIHRYALAMLALKEIELFGAPKQGQVVERVQALRDTLLQTVESRWNDSQPPPRQSDADKSESVPERVARLRRAIRQRLNDPAWITAQGGFEAVQARARVDRERLFVALQAFSYPGDYVFQHPSLERIAETLIKFEQDVIGTQHVVPPGRRIARARFGEPIDLGALLEQHGHPRGRAAVALVTRLVHESLQNTLDAIGPGPLVTQTAQSMRT